MLDDLRGIRMSGAQDDTFLAILVMHTRPFLLAAVLHCRSLVIYKARPQMKGPWPDTVLSSSQALVPPLEERLCVWGSDFALVTRVILVP